MNTPAPGNESECRCSKAGMFSNGVHAINCDGPAPTLSAEVVEALKWTDKSMAACRWREVVDFSAVNAKRAKALERKNQRAVKRAVLFPPRPGQDKKSKKLAKRKKLPSMAKVKKACWDALSLYVRARDAEVNQGLCMICSEKPITLGYHLIPAGSGSMAKWDPLNIVGGCRDCNCGEYNRRVKYAYIHINLFGLEFMNALEAKSRIMVQYKRHDFLEMTQRFKDELEKLRGTK